MKRLPNSKKEEINKKDKMKYITKEVRIGIAGIVALCVLIYGINWLKGIHMFQPSSYFYAKFENVNGLTKIKPGICRRCSCRYRT